MRYVARLIVAFCCAFLFLHSVSAHAERKVALVIGNAAYKAGPLANPVNDATAVAAAFEKQLGFDKVILRKDLAFDGFRTALSEIAQEASGAALAVLYFAGHGMEVNGKNYLIPVDARLAQPAALGLEAIALDLVLEQLAGATRLKLVILDACRDNPFPAAKRGSRGFKRVEPEDNTLVVYAAKDGTTADDGLGLRHSPFTAALLKHIATPGLEVSFVFRRVRDDVVAATKAVQTPHTYGTLGGKELYLKPLAAPLAAAETKPGAAPPPQGQLSEVERMWAAVKDTTSVRALEAFRERHGKENAVYDRLAEGRIEELKKLAMVAPPQVKPEPPKVVTPPVTVAPEPALTPGRVFRDCAEVCPEMVVVPAGSFTMGSRPAEIAALRKLRPSAPTGWYDAEHPLRKVSIARAFAVGKFEVTFSEWDACVAAGGCQHRPGDQGWGRGRRPVINVSWHDAKEYVAWLSRKTEKSYRLLSEAEWEYAARAETTTRYAFGDTISKRQAQFRAGGTAEVGSFAANKFGLHDMHGNVWEWVEDSWHPDYTGAPLDGTVWLGGDVSRRVLRGGAWSLTYPDILRSASRGGDQPDSREVVLGFRVARTL